MSWGRFKHRRQCRYCDQPVRKNRTVTCAAPACLDRLKADTIAAKLAGFAKAAPEAPCPCAGGWVAVTVTERHPPYKHLLWMPCARHEPVTETPSQP